MRESESRRILAARPMRRRHKARLRLSTANEVDEHRHSQYTGRSRSGNTASLDCILQIVCNNWVNTGRCMGFRVRDLVRRQPLQSHRLVEVEVGNAYLFCTSSSCVARLLASDAVSMLELQMHCKDSR